MQQLHTLFGEKQAQAQARARQYHKQYQQWALVRAAFFVVAITAIVWLANARQYLPFAIALFLGITLFLLLIRRHQQLRLHRDHARLLAQINGEEQARLEGNLKGLDGAEEFRDGEHPYANDLDVFGQNSLFQLLNHTTTPNGRQTLADWLRQPASPGEIQARQAAVKELAPLLDERQHWQVVGRYNAKEDTDMAAFLAWLDAPDQLLGRKGWGLLRWLLPALTIALYTSFAMGLLTFGQASAGVLINIFVLGKWFQYSLTVQKSAATSIQGLRGYEALLAQMEQYTAHAPRLQALTQPLHHQGQPASAILRQLKVTLDRFDSRANLLYVMVNLLLVLDLHGLWTAERWRARHRTAVRQWFQVVGQWEALCSLAATHHSHPQWALPTLSHSPFAYQATQLGHPLIPATKRVANDFALQQQGTIAVVTGSNMAGKSTFLRTVGVNAVLAYAGAPVCAQQMEIGVMQLFTSMRTQDNLEESISSFFAELRRIRQLLHRLDTEDTPVLFMLDEILKGTNSQDRHRGAAGLVRQLNQEQAMGLISTHDLELGELATELQGVVNYSFNSQVQGEDIRFDYRLCHGLCQEFNAAALMAKMGIKVENRA